ncbi:phosphate ABC transporter substrate-binding/OmpA family protein [Cellvibrio japonicus]|uniref:OmpA family protein n=1 Tax=Cellvibrio japonicus (strain Ueda107) TaxID=498211 RepID=B3PBS8_CELJU|nr:phosphate ABC transporter substrate-binding/OmpA family protein [Cellvibrio japonicus]ACE83949.1 OmpA family protein [Cellvibrio japonicus Ueda107]QEI11746.1 OmpA family protein [Cellvibrio japonicus]QEI15320.1 OmpA family protein [Cellvibrio japonicus]QEI18900.1 OmpA family protein [Cellvibrio japonicus]
MSPKSHKQIHYNVALVDKLWNLKRLCEAHLKMHIPLNMVLKDEEYRAELLEKALSTENSELTQLVWDIRQMEDAIVSASHEGKSFKPKKKSRKGIRLHYWGLVTSGLLLFLCGYLFRAFLPLDAGQVFIGQAVAGSQVQATANTHTNKPASTFVAGERAQGPLFRIHGSNTLGEKLAPRLVESWLMAKGATNIATEQGATATEKMISAHINGRVEYVEIHAHGSSTAFTDLMSGKADMGMSSRRIKLQERELLMEKLGDLTEQGSEQIVGLDGLAIVTHPANPISNLSLPQLVNIFSGKVNNWSQLGGKNLPIQLYARDEASGTWDSFKSLVLDPAQASLSPTAQRFESSTQLSDSVAKDEGGIGFIGLPYVRRAKLLSISSAEGSTAIMPTHFTISTEDYPLARRLYFYLPQHNLHAEAEEFAKFSNSERGQGIVEDIGFISQNIKAGQPFANNFYPPEMRDLTLRSQRLSINFRFKDGSDQLDSKSLSDLERLVKYVEVNAPKRLQLFGFSDSEGDKHENLALSLRRAKVVEDHLIKRGIYPLVAKGMGDEAPLASSDTEAGRHINRRVEVWIL